MNTSSNMRYRDYNYVLNTLATFGAAVALAGTAVAAEVNPVTPDDTQGVNLQTRYDNIADYGYAQQTTQGDFTVKNDLEMLRNIEISKFNDKIFNSFSERIVKHWIPAEGILDETCLFVTIENQEELMSRDGYDFELDLYEQLEEEIASSRFFNMIALL